MIQLTNHMRNDQKAMFYDDAAMNRLNQSRFDFIIIDNISTPQYVLPYLLDRPFAVFGIECSVGAFRMPYSPSFVPNMLTLFSDNMNLWQRMVNTLLHAFMTSDFAWYMLTGTTSTLVPHKPAIPISDLFSEAQLCLRTKAPLVETVRPTQPNVINVNIIGRPAKPLSSELESFLRNAQYSSVVLVSFGSWLDQLPESVIVRFLAAFAQLKMTVLWKYTGRLDVDVPSNVFLMMWIPQNDLLAHNQTKLLITHGGQYSITEAMYHGVPMITFPIMVDQLQNSIAAESKGIALHLPREFAPADLIRMINATQQDDMQKTTRRTSEIFRSLSEAGSSSVAFWIDHVIRFGGRELRPASMDLRWWQYMLLDVAFAYSLLAWLVWRIGCKFAGGLIRRRPHNQHRAHVKAD
ncbi:hypothetical protein CAPTEDRAFT_90649 [Capitella teleta]|uniref:UDP-glucuronosyltransferase n=1 Tax=Capitella teleta TaxID=283909 RepID=R7URJ9_CAPTE|nr:hypothetical protein CAPTEDRAFT_90649 [Capitella teleta]|eukprot:ELU06532.1 hypothetical protein CAPTEDRAFT_90649 [Capitella teleta]